jgi:hypothetical protein
VFTTLLERGLPGVLTVFVFVAVTLLERSSEIVSLFHVTALLEFGLFYEQRMDSCSI